MKYLADTNIFLEILLGQKNKENCKTFLTENSTNVSISDFSLHSIGVILFRVKRFSIFDKFYNDVQGQVRIISLPSEKYPLAASFAQKFDLDFDDSYQCAVAKEFDLQIIAQDQDFKKVVGTIEITLM